MKYYTIVDLGGTRIKLGVFQEEELIGFHIFSADSHRDFSIILDEISSHIREILPSSVSSLEAIVFSFPGLVDVFQKKIITFNNKYVEAASFDIQSWAKKNWGAHFYIDNDARLACLGEWKYGNSRKYSNVVMVTLGTGIGTSVVIGDRLLLGKHFQAGCLGGHLTVNYKGKACSCGNVGCAEYEASSWRLSEILSKNIDNPQLWLKEHGLSDTQLNFKNILELVEKNDMNAKKIYQICCEIWGACVVSLIHAYDPEIVILGGGIISSKNIFFQEIIRYAENHAWTPNHEVLFDISFAPDKQALYGGLFLAKNPDLTNKIYLT